MLLFPKQSRIRDKKHLEFVRTLYCIRCCSLNVLQEHWFTNGIEACHIRKNTDGGIAIKPSDSFVLPICSYHHKQQHQVGEVKFYGDRIDKAISLAHSLYSVTGQREKAIALIKEAEL